MGVDSMDVQHRDLVQAVGLIEQKIAAAPADHVRFLRDWLVDHIRNEDYVLGVHLNTLIR